MNPALSVIAFTTLSGAGYGMLIWIGALAALLPQAVPRPLGAIACVCGMALCAVGLTASMLHLGRPARAWRAVSQWRSSWLSREAIAALFGFVPASALAACLLVATSDATLLRTLGAATALLAALTVFCTARIYTSLGTIAAWHNGLVMPVYALLCLWSGLLALWLIGALGGVSAPAALLPTLIVLTFAALALKAIYWRHIDRTGSPGSTGAATGLGYLGTVRAFEAPHTESNYLLREMGFRLARKHASRLRSLTILLLAAICVAVGAAWAWPRSATSFALLCFALAAAALFVERWLFFAQAQHLVTHYYGRSAA